MEALGRVNGVVLDGAAAHALEGVEA